MMTRIVAILIFVTLFITSGYTQSTEKHYVVIGGFARVDNAIRFTERASREGFEAKYALNPLRNIYYVYIYQSNNRKAAFEFCNKTKAESSYHDCWVFSGTLGDQPVVVTPQPEPVEEPVRTPPTQQPAVEEPVQEEPVVNEPEETIVNEPVASKPSGKPVIFRLVSNNGEPVKGHVTLRETERADEYQGYPGNETVYVVPPANKANRWYMRANVMGYTPVKKIINYTDARGGIKDSEVGPNGELVIPVKLERAKKGVYMEMEYVRFHTNSNVIKTSSKDELDQLASLMLDNTKYHIRIFGHVNGKGSREAKYAGDDLFEYHEGLRTEEISAKKLSTLMAESVKQYLVDKGVEAKRVDVKGEGGAVMVYRPGSSLEDRNNRVEVGITKN